MIPTNSIERKVTIEYSLANIAEEVISFRTNGVQRCIDFIVALLFILIFSWLYLLLAFLVKLSSKGAVIYSHERIGLNGTPFSIYKFRTMYENAEKNGPELSSHDDMRVTPIGKILRKIHLDELPQFYNVLIGDMSVIGTRPERAYYINQIVKTAPYYKMVLSKKPGITSWGQLNFGYAKNVEEMVERLNYDIFYLKNQNFLFNLKIVAYTTLMILSGKDKLSL